MAASGTRVWRRRCERAAAWRRCGTPSRRRARPVASCGWHAGCGRTTRARPVRSEWAASRAACATNTAAFPRSARSRSRRRWPTCSRRSTRPSLRDTRVAELEALVVAGTRGRRPPRRFRCCGVPGRATSDASGGTRHCASLPTRCARRRPSARSSTPPAGAATRPASCCSAWPACTAPTTSTTAPITVIRRRAWRLQRAIGTGTATVALDDLEHADLVVVIGANPASNHPRLITQLVGAAPPRRPGHRHQSVARDRAGALPRPVRLAQHAVRLARSPTCTCSRTSARRGAAETAAARRSSSAGRVDRTFVVATTSKAGRRVEADVMAATDGRRCSPRAACRGRAGRGRSADAGAARSARSSPGRWASRSTRTASTTCRRSSIWRSPAAWSGDRARGCCRSAATATCRASGRWA